MKTKKRLDAMQDELDDFGVCYRNACKALSTIGRDLAKLTKEVEELKQRPVPPRSSLARAGP